MKNILLVEDDLDISKALSIRLKAAGYRVHTAEDALQGLLAAVREQPDLMILDVSMPAGDGFSIVERMLESEELPATPFIILTASKRPEYRIRARELGAYAYFEKPYDSSALISTIDRALSAASSTD